MFNLSALLLDDALKPATPVANVFNCCFYDTDIFISASVATHLRSDGIFNVSIITHFFLIVK